MRVVSSTLDLSATHRNLLSVEVEQRPESRRAAEGPRAETPSDSVEIADIRSLVAMWLYEFVTGKHARAPEAIRVHAPSRSAAHLRGVPFTRREIRREAENTCFTAEGSVTLAGGKRVDFTVELRMNRERTLIDGVSVRAGNMSDPLALNLDGAGVRLAGGRLAFDLDGDGADEEIATLAPGSAWLAFDRNGNGEVDGGRELFGPGTGDGFLDLAGLDSDRSGWIDSADDAWSRLALWSGSGLTPLADAGVGALSVDSVSTPFTLEPDGEVLGQVRQSGVFLREDGTAGALEQIDLRV